VGNVTKANTTGQGPAPDLAERAGYLIEVAARAPSVHNTQPWRFTDTGPAIELYADTSRQLLEDPAGREMIISCGAALFGLRLAIRLLGYHPEADLFPEPGQRHLLARVRAGADPQQPDAARSAAAAAEARRGPDQPSYRPTSRRGPDHRRRSAPLEGTKEFIMTCTLHVAWDDRLADYDFGPAHPMAPVRLKLTIELARAFGLFHLDQVSVEVPAAATRSELELYHAPAYIDVVRLAGSGRLLDPSNPGMTERVLFMHGLGTEDDPVFPGMHEAAAMVAGATLAAARAVWTSAAQHGASIAAYATRVFGDRNNKLAAAARGAVVAFEADQLDLAGQSGWSVTAIGPSREVTDPGELTRLRTIGLRPWAPGERDHFVCISPIMLNGRRLCAGGSQLTQRPG
jgi:Pyridoxamine 5'-phosphate oxidase/Histone deacetylase domain